MVMLMTSLPRVTHTPQPVWPVSSREKLPLHSIPEAPVKAVECFGSPAEFLRCGFAVSIQFPGMLDYPPPGNGQPLYLAPLKMPFSTLLRGYWPLLQYSGKRSSYLGKLTYCRASIFCSACQFFCSPKRNGYKPSGLCLRLFGKWMHEN